MRSGLEDASARLKVTVTKEMSANLAGSEIHPLYSTFWICRHMELAARQTIEPFFEVGENAIGTHLEVRHLSMVPLEADVIYESTVESITGNKVVCAIEGRWNGVVFCRGTQTQAFMPDTRIKDRIASIYDSVRLPIGNQDEGDLD